MAAAPHRARHRPLARTVLAAFAFAFVFAATSGVRDASADEGAAMLHVVSAPLGEVLVDGEPTGRRTPVSDLAVPPGSHRVEVRFDDGRVSPAVTRQVAAGRTAYVYARPAEAAGDDADCETNDQRACWQAIESALRHHDIDAAKRRAARYVERFPEGAYHRLARNVIENADAPPRRTTPAARPAPSRGRDGVKPATVALGVAAFVAVVALVALAFVVVRRLRAAT